MIGQLFTTGIGIYQMYPGTENKSNWCCFLCGVDYV